MKKIIAALALTLLSSPFAMALTMPTRVINQDPEGKTHRENNL